MPLNKVKIFNERTHLYLSLLNFGILGKCPGFPPLEYALILPNALSTQCCGENKLLLNMHLHLAAHEINLKAKVQYPLPWEVDLKIQCDYVFKI